MLGSAVGTRMPLRITINENNIKCLCALVAIERPFYGKNPFHLVVKGRVEIWRGGGRFSRNCVSDPFGLSVSEYLTVSAVSRSRSSNRDVRLSRVRLSDKGHSALAHGEARLRLRSSR